MTEIRRTTLSEARRDEGVNLHHDATLGGTTEDVEA
jgi:hypothetical protein